MSNEEASEKGGIHIPLLVDTTLLVIIVFQAGISWSKINTLTEEVTALRQQYVASQTLQPTYSERLARIEENIIYMRRDVEQMRAEILRTRPMTSAPAGVMRKPNDP